MINGVFNPDSGFLADLAGDGVLQAFSGFDETGNCRITLRRPACLASKQAARAIVHKYDDGGVDTRKLRAPAIRVAAAQDMSSAMGFVTCAAAAAELMLAMPQ